MIRASTNVTCPNLDRLLNEQSAERILGEDLGIAWGDAQPKEIRIERAWRRREGGFAIEWSFGLGRARFSVSVATSAELDRWGEENGADGHRTPKLEPWGLGGLHVWMPDRSACVFTPDRDPQLAQLGDCLSSTRMGQYLDIRTPEADGQAQRSDVYCHLMGYRAGRRAAIAYTVDGGNPSERRLLGKAFYDDRAERLLSLHERVGAALAEGSNRRVRVPRPVKVLRDFQMVLFAWEDGRRKPRGFSAQTEFFAAGAAALGVLHNVNLPGLPRFGMSEELCIADHWREALETAFPFDAEAVGEIADRLHVCAAQVELGPDVTLHRDFYEKQFLVRGGTVTLLDLDTLASGPAEVDLGNLLAHATLLALQHEAGIDEFSRLCRSCIEGYEDGGGRARGKALALFTATALLRIGGVHRFRTASRRFTGALWRVAAELAGLGQRRGAGCVGHDATGVHGVGMGQVMAGVFGERFQ
ncbi:MAG: hypothetical protein AABZ12_02405 [Planctomycetota bacterium]